MEKIQSNLHFYNYRLGYSLLGLIFLLKFKFGSPFSLPTLIDNWAIYFIIVYYKYNSQDTISPYK